MTLLATAYWTTGPNKGELREQSLSPPGPDQVLVRTRFSAISRGSECLVQTGRVPESQREVMRAPFQEGGFPWPVKYGYSNVGIVEDGPDELKGQAVFCLYPHQSAFVVAAESVLPVPEGVPLERAVLAANMETAVNALWDGSPNMGDRVAVLGAGVVGALIAYLATAVTGLRVDLSEPDRGKHEAMESLGLKVLQPSELATEYDVVFHASGHPDGLCTALQIAGFEARIVEVSWYGARQVALPLGEAFHSRRLTLQSSQVGHVAPSHRGRWSRRRRLALALSLLTDPRLDVLFSGECSFRDLPERLSQLCKEPRGAFCERIRYTG